MKKLFIATMMLGVFLFTACNSGTSNKNQSESEHTEMNQMTPGESHSEMDHMTPAASNEEHAMLGVKGSCEMCKERIEKTAKGINGVQTASWDLNTKQLHLGFDPSLTSADAVAKAVAKAGHDTDNYKADKATYDALPDC